MARTNNIQYFIYIGDRRCGRAEVPVESCISGSESFLHKKTTYYTAALNGCCPSERDRRRMEKEISMFRGVTGRMENWCSRLEVALTKEQRDALKRVTWVGQISIAALNCAFVYRRSNRTQKCQLLLILNDTVVHEIWWRDANHLVCSLRCQLFFKPR